MATGRARSARIRRAGTTVSSRRFSPGRHCEGRVSTRQQSCARWRTLPEIALSPPASRNDSALRSAGDFRYGGGGDGDTAAGADPAQRPFLDAMPGEPGERQDQRERAEEHLPPRRAAAREPHHELLARPAVDVDAV